jgi:polar amino acid transport system substrate-binding protein
MKKVFALILAAALCVATLAACGGTSESAAGSAAADANAATSAAASAADADASAAGYKLAKDGVLTMATNAYFPPYEYYEGEKIVGIDAEIAAAVADKLGLELKIEDMEFDSIITAVQTGKADMGLAGMTVTEERLKNIDFTEPYAQGIQVIIVKEDSPIATKDDLKDKKIGVQLSTTGDLYAKDDYGEQNVVEYNKGNDAVMALVQGQVDAVIIDNEPAKSYVSANEGLKILDTEYAVEDYAACIAKENPELTKAINQALTELKDDGTIQSILDKYIKA